MGDHEAGEGLEQVGHDVAAPLGDEPFKAFDHEVPDVVLNVCHLSGGESRADEPPERRVVGRVEEHDRGGLTHVHPGSRLDGQPAGRREGPGVACGVEHVGEPRQEPETVVVVSGGHVVHRVVVAQVPVHGEGVPPRLTGSQHKLGGGHGAQPALGRTMKAMAT